MAKSDRLYVRIDEELKTQAQEVAASENRTLSNYIETLIKEDIEERSHHDNHRIKEIFR